MGNLTAPTLTAIRNYIEKYSLLTGIIISTPYVALDLVDVEEIISIMVYADNTDNTDREHTLTLTIDGEVYVYPSADLDDGDTLFLRLNALATAPGDNPVIVWRSDVSTFGLLSYDGANYHPLGKYGGRSVELVWQIDEAPGTAQQFRVDCAYKKREVI